MLKNITIYSIGNIIPQAATFLLLPLYTRYLIPAEYGIVQSMHVMAGILTVLMTLAIDRSIYRFYFEYNTIDKRKAFLGTITISLLSISTITLFILLIMRSTVALIFESISFYPYFAYAITTVYLTVLGIIPKVYFQVEEKAGKFIKFSLGEFFLKTILIIFFVVYAGRGAEGMLLGGLLSAFFLSPVYIYVISKIIIPKWDKNIFIENIKYSYPMVVGLLSGWILNLSDRVFIERFLSITDVGIYSLAYKIAGILMISTTAINQAYNPIFFKIANDDSYVNPKKKLFTYNKNISIITVVFAIIITMFSKEFIMILSHEYSSAYSLVPIIMVGIIFSQIGGLYNRAYYQEKTTIQPTLIGLAAAVLNVLLNILWVPRYGIVGAAYSTVISFMLMFILIYSFSKRYYYIPINWSTLLPIFTLFIFISVFFFYFNFSIIIGLLLKISICIVLGLLLWNKYKGVVLKSLIHT